MAIAPSTSNFRLLTLRIYRIFSCVVLAALVVAGLDALGIFGDGELPEPLYTLSVVFMFGAVFAWIPGFFFALAGSVKLAHEWKVAMPMWLFVAASMAMVFYQWLGAQEPGLLAASGWLLAASALAAAWSGWTQR